MENKINNLNKINQYKWMIQKISRNKLVSFNIKLQPILDEILNRNLYVRNYKFLKDNIYNKFKFINFFFIIHRNKKRINFHKNR